MSSILQHSISGNHFVVSAQKCLYWEEEKALILSDLHLGKSGHFRKNGIAVPQHVFKEDMQRLFSLIQFYSPQKVIIAGDLFHSRSNKEHDFFVRWRNDIPATPTRVARSPNPATAPARMSQPGVTMLDPGPILEGRAGVQDRRAIQRRVYLRASPVIAVLQPGHREQRAASDDRPVDQAGDERHLAPDRRVADVDAGHRAHRASRRAPVEIYGNLDLPARTSERWVLLAERVSHLAGVCGDIAKSGKGWERLRFIGDNLDLLQANLDRVRPKP